MGDIGFSTNRVSPDTFSPPLILKIIYAIRQVGLLLTVYLCVSATGRAASSAKPPAPSVPCYLSTGVPVFK